MELFAFEQAPTHPPAEGWVCEIVEDEERFKYPSELTYRTIEVVPRPTSEQAFEGHRGGRLPRRKGGEELAYAVLEH